MEATKIAILHSELAGYSMACLKTLKQRYNVEILLFYWPPVSNAPFKFCVEGADHIYPRNKYSLKEMKTIVEDFNPDLLKMSGWMDRDYLKMGRMAKEKGIPVVAGLDAQWTGSYRQQAASLLSSLHLKRHIDILWVCGERQLRFANKLGYKGDQVRFGAYCCDWDRFALSWYLNGSKENAFLFAGRFVREKGLGNLIEAYKKYRETVEDPWKLYCAGTGALESQLKDVPGVEVMGFIQPEKLPDLMQRCNAFVLPSHYEPWGVVIQEAAASGLPVICSDACGAGAHLVQDGYNGYIFEAGNTDHLASAMMKMSNLSESQHLEMAEAGFELSKQFKPERWADTLMEMASAGKQHNREKESQYQPG